MNRESLQSKNYYVKTILTGTIHVLLLDDDPSFLQKEKGILEMLTSEYPDLNFVFYSYSSGNDIEDEFLKNIDIAFLDICIPGEIDLALAYRLKAASKSAIIILVTQFSQYAEESYEVGVFRYLMKSNLESKLPVYFRMAISERKKEQHVLTVTSFGERISCRTQEILYICTDGKKLALFLCKDQQSPVFFYGQLKELQNTLIDENFIRTHRGYLVNASFIKDVTHKGITLTTGQALPISEQYYSKIKDRFLEYRISL